MSSLRDLCLLKQNESYASLPYPSLYLVALQFILLVQLSLSLI